jgi:hypothetical protein
MSDVETATRPGSEHEDNNAIEVHIVGFTNSRRDAPWDRWQEPGVELWGINNLHITEQDTPVSRCHRWFDLHPAEAIKTDLKHVEWLQQQTRPTYMFGKAVPLMVESDVPGESLRVFPEDELVALYGTSYFTNSISWQLAFAGVVLRPALERWKRWQRIEALGVEKLATPAQINKMRAAADLEEAPAQPTIGVHGVDMATDTEYGAQRPSCEYFIGLLAGAGYRIQIARASDLLQTAGMYGTDDNGALRAKMLARRAELQEQLGKAQAERSNVVNRTGQLDGQINHINGAIADVTYWLDRWTMPEVDRDVASKPGQLD